MREKKKVSIRVAILSLFCLFCVTTFVSRLASLRKVEPRTSTVPLLNAYSACFLTNVVLAIPCALFSAHLQLHIYPSYSLIKLLLQHPIHFSLG
jgi:hypothetical protein